MGNSVNKLFNKLKELKVSFTPRKTLRCNFWITFLSKFNAVKESNFWSTPGSIVLKLFWAKSRKAKLLRSLTAPGISFNWQPFKFKFFSEFSKPRRALSDMVTLLSANFNVFSLNVTKALSGMYLIWLSVKSSCDKSLRGLNGDTGTLLRLLEAKLRLWSVFSKPRKAFSDTEIMSQAVKRCTREVMRNWLGMMISVWKLVVPSTRTLCYWQK